MLTVLLSLAARAQEVPAGQPPLAQRPEARPPGEGALTREQLDAILTFRAEHLQVRELGMVIPGVTVVRSGWGWGPRPWRGFGWGTTDVITSPPELLDSWVVYQGPQRLTVPEFLDAVGRTEDANLLERKIRRNHSVGSVFSGLAVMGLATGVGGLVGSFADDPSRQLTWTGVSLGGFGSAILSGIVGSAGNNRATKLAEDFPESPDLARVQEAVRSYNEELRQDLELTPEQAYRELDRPRRRAGDGS